MPANADDLGTAEREAFDDRVDSIASWLSDLDTRVRATELATGDERTAKELRRAVEALSKHDPKLEKRLTDRVDVLADRLATLASTLSTTAASLARKDGEIAALRKELDAGTKRIESLAREQTKNGSSEELERLRAAVRTVQADRPARTGEARIADLATKVNFLAERVDTLGQTVATTAAGLAGRDGELATLRQRLEESSTRIERTAVELRRVEDRDSSGALEELRSVVDATSARLDAREDETAAVRARIDEAYARIGTVVTELQASIATLSSQVTALETLPATTVAALDARAAEIDTRLDGLVVDLSAVGASSETANQALAARELETAALTRRVDETNERLDTAVEELRAALAKLPAAGTIDPAVDARLAAIDAQTVEAADLHGTLLAEVTARLDAMAGEHESVTAEVTRVAVELDGEREAARGRLDAFEGVQSAVTADVVRLSAALEAEREALATARAETTEAADRYGSQLAEVTARVDAMEGGHTSVAAELTRVAAELDSGRETTQARIDALESSQSALAADARAALETEREALGARIDNLAAALSAASEQRAGGEEWDGVLHKLEARIAGLEDANGAVSQEVEKRALLWSSELDAIGTRLAEATGSISEDVTRGYVETRRLVAELTGRLDSVEQSAGAAEHSPSSVDWEAERGELMGRIDEVAARLAELGSSAAAASAVPASADLDQLRVSLEGIRMRLASNEQELAALVADRESGSRVEELARRLDALERAPVLIAGTADGGPVAGDGRFRVEMRALELRTEVAEATARENREAVLVQLERLAARVDWRFQRLEAELEAYAPEEASGGRVVPIRPEL